MININIEALEKITQEAKGVFKDGLIASDVWDRETGLSLAGINQQPEAVALFTGLISDINSTLTGSGFPGLGPYCVMELKNNNLFVVVQHGKDLLQGFLLDATKANLGLLFGMVIPRALEAVAKARG